MPKNDFPHDAAYKAIFSFPSMVSSLLLDFLPEQFVQYFDFNTLELAKTSFVRKGLKQLHNDIIWRLRWYDKPSVLALLLEFQSSDDYWMSARIFAYTGNFWLDYIKGHKLKTGDMLPAIFPIVLYNGERPWKAPTSIQSLIAQPYSQFMDTQPVQTYYVIDARHIPRDTLAKAAGDAAYIIRGEQARTGAQLAEIGMEFLGRQTGGETANLETEVVKWLEKRIRKVEPGWKASAKKEQSPMMLSELLEKMQSEIKKCRQAAREEGLAEGRAEGRAEGLTTGELKGKAAGRAEAASCQRAGLLEMLALKFGEIPAEWQEYIEKLDSPEQICSLTIAVLTTHSQAEYKQLLLAASASY